MFINFTPHNAKSSSSKASSCANVFEYLEKEDRILEKNNVLFDRQVSGFFDQNDINIPKEKVIRDIDDNRFRRSFKESNFYMINISPSYKEQKHLLNRVDNFLNDKIKNENLKLSDKELAKAKDTMMKDLLMNYSRDVMKGYASNFNREVNGRKINENDLVYFGRVETQRTYNFKDRDVMENNKIQKKINITKDPNKIRELENKLRKDYFTNEIIKEGNVKGGLNYHVHVVVSRHTKLVDENLKLSLSPMSKYKLQESKLKDQENKEIGFNRDKFFQSTENIFDDSFKFNRDLNNSYEALKRNSNTKGTRENFKKQNINIVDLGKNIGINKIKNELKNYVGVNFNSPVSNLRMQMSQELGIKIPKNLSIPTNPASLTFKVVKSVVKTIEKGYGM